MLRQAEGSGRGPSTAAAGALLLAALAFAPLLIAQRAPALVITGGEVYDGTGAAARRVDVRVEGDTIVEVGPALAPHEGDRVIAAAGLAVSPGFIDVHSHADGQLDERPDAESQVRQGITTALVGQDGGGALPVSDLFEQLARVPPSINVATSVGHGAVRRVVMGGDFQRAATPAEIETMAAIVERGMRDGALGLSSGLEYDPGFFATVDELVALAKVAGRFGGFFSSHVRDEENAFAAAWQEAIEVGRRAGVPVQISHMKAASKPAWGRAAEALRALEAAERDGVRVRGDWYPYPYWHSSIYVLIPDRDFADVGKWRVGLDEIGGAANVLVTSYRPDPSLNGRTLDAIARARGIDPAALIVELVRTAGPDIGIIGTSMDERDMRAILAHPQVLICSDGQIGGTHPRGAGAFPRVLGRYVREQQVIALEEAIAKMTSRSAAHIGLGDRGAIAPGRKADLVIFDPRTVIDRATPEAPTAAPEGIHTVIVNGQVVLDAGRMTGARPGRGLRRSGS